MYKMNCQRIAQDFGMWVKGRRAKECELTERTWYNAVNNQTQIKSSP